MRKLNKYIDNISGGQLAAFDVMGIRDLDVYTGAPTMNNRDGYFWTRFGIGVNNTQLKFLLDTQSKRGLNDDEEFLKDYISKLYNK